MFNIKCNTNFTDVDIDVKEHTALYLYLPQLLLLSIQCDLLEIFDKVYSSRLGLLDQLLTEPDWELHTDWSSCMENGQQ